MDLGTTYLGIGLRTPLVPSASPLSEDLDKIRQMEQAGASAIVLHSLFEEQTEADAAAGPEFRVGPKAYLEHIRRAKSAVKIPIIGSLNCTTLGGWISYTRQITEAGADALELNIYRIPTQPNADGLVLFNRFYQPDIDLEKMEVTPNLTLSVPADMRLALHWIGILYGKVRANLAATSGIYQAYDVIKMIMAGADVTMLCSALMRYGITHIQRIEMDLAAWLEQHHHNSLRELKGVMSQQNCPDPSAFERAQYVRGLSSYTSLFPVRR